MEKNLEQVKENCVVRWHKQCIPRSSNKPKLAFNDSPMRYRISLSEYSNQVVCRLKHSLVSVDKNTLNDRKGVLRINTIWSLSP